MVTWCLLLLHSALAAPPSVSVGQNALTFSLPVINTGEADEDPAAPAQISLSTYVGVLPNQPSAAVVLYFFSRREGADQLATLDRLQRRYDGQGVRILAINTDTGSVGALSSWLEEQQLGYPVLRDNHHVVRNRYGVEDLPFTVVVDQRGYIFAMGAPSATELSESLEAELGFLLNNPDPTAQP